MKAIPTCRSPLRAVLPGALTVFILAVSAAAVMVLIGEGAMPLVSSAQAAISCGR